MNKKNFILAFLLPAVGVIPLVILGTMEADIVDSLGYATWNTLMVIGVILVVVLSFLPFIRIFKGIFGGAGSWNYFWGKGKAAKEVLVTGKSATATVISISENSEGGVVTINNQPLLNLKLKISYGYGQPYEVSFNTIIPRTIVHQFQPGVQFQVKVDPMNNQNVVYDPQKTKTMKKPTIGGKNWSDSDNLLLETSGIDGMAKLVSVTETGRMEDFKQVFAIEYEVFTPGKEAYIIKKELPVPFESQSLMKNAVGKSFKAKIHPYDKEKIVVSITS